MAFDSFAIMMGSWGVTMEGFLLSGVWRDKTALLPFKTISSPNIFIHIAFQCASSLLHRCFRNNALFYLFLLLSVSPLMRFTLTSGPGDRVWTGSDGISP